MAVCGDGNVAHAGGQDTRGYGGDVGGRDKASSHAGWDEIGEVVWCNGQGGSIADCIPPSTNDKGWEVGSK